MFKFDEPGKDKCIGLDVFRNNVSAAGASLEIIVLETVFIVVPFNTNCPAMVVELFAIYKLLVLPDSISKPPIDKLCAPLLGNVKFIFSEIGEASVLPTEDAPVAPHWARSVVTPLVLPGYPEVQLVPPVQVELEVDAHV